MTINKMVSKINNSTISQQKRQIEYWGAENQKKLYDSKVLILGSQTLGQMVLGCSAGLGVGNILICDNIRTSKNEYDFLAPNLRGLEGVRKMEMIEENARKINDNIYIKTLHSKLSKGLLKFLDFEPDIVVDTQNNGLLKEESLDYAIKNDIKHISAFSDGRKAIINVYNGKNIDDIINENEINANLYPYMSVSAGVSAGII